MTVEIRATIQLSDFLAVEYECLGCHAKAVRPLRYSSSHGSHRVPNACGNCGAAWMTDQSRAGKDLAILFDLMAAYGDPAAKLPFSVRLEFRGLERLAPETRTTNDGAIS
jgi:hypothetical protein